MKNKIQKLTTEERAYIAGFLDGDGSIFAQIVKRSDYRLLFQIKITVSFTQKKTRSWFLLWLQKKVGFGVIREGKNGYWDYTVTENLQVKVLLDSLAPFLVIKNKTARLSLHLIASLSKKQSIQSFLYSCALVDKIATFTDSKKQRVTTQTVRGILTSF